MSRRSPRPVGLAIDSLADSLAPPTLLSEIQRRWPEVAGEAIAREATPTAERAGQVTLTCSSSVWAQELDLLAPELVERLNAILSRGSVAGLRCQAAPVGRWSGKQR